MASTKTMDLTEGPILGKLVRFTIPIILGNLLQQLYTAADRVVVGRFAADGAGALAAIGATASAINLLIFQIMWVVPTYLIAGWVNKF